MVFSSQYSTRFSQGTRSKNAWFYLGQEDPELVEMGAKNNLAMTNELRSAFQPFWSEDRFEDEFETVYITGVK